jgi:hypothetical protein
VFLELGALALLGVLVFRRPRAAPAR